MLSHAQGGRKAERSTNWEYRAHHWGPWDMPGHPGLGGHHRSSWNQKYTPEVAPGWTGWQKITKAQEGPSGPSILSIYRISLCSQHNHYYVQRFSTRKYVVILFDLLFVFLYFAGRHNFLCLWHTPCTKVTLQVIFMGHLRCQGLNLGWLYRGKHPIH